LILLHAAPQLVQEREVMNKRAAELPMNTIIIVVLVIIVLAAVGLFFFMQFSKGVGATTEATDTAKTGSAQLTNKLDWDSLKCKRCGDYCTDTKDYADTNIKCAGASNYGANCIAIGCKTTCYSAHQGNYVNIPQCANNDDVCVGTTGSPNDMNC